MSLTIESLNVFLILGNQKNPDWNTQTIPSICFYLLK